MPPCPQACSWALHGSPFPRKKLWKMPQLPFFCWTCCLQGPGRCWQLDRAEHMAMPLAKTTTKRHLPYFGVPEHHLWHLLGNATAKCSPSLHQPALPCATSPPLAHGTELPMPASRTTHSPRNGSKMGAASTTKVHHHQSHLVPSCPATIPYLHIKGNSTVKPQWIPSLQCWSCGLNLVLKERAQPTCDHKPTPLPSHPSHFLYRHH